jgi:hypothetical protein
MQPIPEMKTPNQFATSFQNSEVHKNWSSTKLLLQVCISTPPILLTDAESMFDQKCHKAIQSKFQELVWTISKFMKSGVSNRTRIKLCMTSVVLGVSGIIMHRVLGHLHKFRPTKVCVYYSLELWTKSIQLNQKIAMNKFRLCALEVTPFWQTSLLHSTQ